MAHLQRIAHVYPPREDLDAVAVGARERSAENAKKNAIHINHKDTVLKVKQQVKIENPKGDQSRAV